MGRGQLAAPALRQHQTQQRALDVRDAVRRGEEAGDGAVQGGEGGGFFGEGAVGVEEGGEGEQQAWG